MYAQIKMSSFVGIKYYIVASNLSLGKAPSRENPTENKQL